MRNFAKLSFIVLMTGLGLASVNARAGSVEIKDNQLFVDGAPQPQLYGAEVQYFRLRGGEGRNIPRAKVIALWNEALDRMVEAHMNAISFYIPWDFHEYAEGKFDFTGTVDEDGDGNPDYPSRDIVTFFRLIKEHGIQHIMVRPGPYINAEWGFLGFGAIPLWLHQNYPQTHMRSSDGLSTKLYDYQDPVFREKSKNWLSELYRQVLKDYIGPGKPVDFIQLDNETNYMWQSLFNHDYSAAAKGRYRDFLKTRYCTLDVLNRCHGTAWKSWDQIEPPTQAGVNVAEDQDWYRFHDSSIHEYLHYVRTMWEGLGVNEPQVLFTLAESYNATQDGLLPNYIYRNDPGVTGMMTVNLYPKTYETPDHPLLNNPFKADHDVKAADEANDHYLGRREEWALGPEIQGGWWRGIEVTPEARKQTYLSTIGHGLKALFIYYFNEGDNWQSDWLRQQVQPIFNAIRIQPQYADIPDARLPDAFWKELQRQADHQIVAGVDVRSVLSADPAVAAKLYFDAPLDGDAKPGKQYALVKEIGEKLVAPHQDFLARAIEMTDPVCMLKDVDQHVPSKVAGIDSVSMNSDWSAGLLGLLFQSGINPSILHWGLTPPDRLDSCRIIVVQDNGIDRPELSAKLQTLMQKGTVVVNFLDDSLARGLGVHALKKPIFLDGAVTLSPVAAGAPFGARGTPLFHYDLGNSGCTGILKHETEFAGYRCNVGKGAFYQVGALFYDVFNADGYAKLKDARARSAFFDGILAASGLNPRVHLTQAGKTGDRLVAFGRQDTEGHKFWVTVKNGAPQAAKFSIRFSAQDLHGGKKYRVQDIFSGKSDDLSGAKLTKSGLGGSLDANGSTVYFIEEL